MTDRTLRSRSARSAVFVVQEELRNLRQHVADPAPDWTRIAASAHALSSSLKRLYKFLDDHDTTPEQRRTAEPPAQIDIAALAHAIKSVRYVGVCPVCDGLLPASEGASIEPAPATVPEESRAGALRSVAAADRHS